MGLLHLLRIIETFHELLYNLFVFLLLSSEFVVDGQYLLAVLSLNFQHFFFKLTLKPIGQLLPALFLFL